MVHGQDSELPGQGVWFNPWSGNLDPTGSACSQKDIQQRQRKTKKGDMPLRLKQMESLACE